MTQNGLKFTPTGGNSVADDALTKREREIIALLLGGGRVATIARSLFVSDHTVRNHLKSIFSKLDLHSQAELIAWARREAENANPENATTLANRLEALRGEGSSLFDEIVRIAADDRGIAGLKRAIRAVLPLDPEKRTIWRERFSVWSEPAEQELLLRQEKEERHQRWTRLFDVFVDEHGQGPLRPGLDQLEFFRALSALVLGAAMRLIRDDDPEAVRHELAMLDEYLETACRSEAT